jgi:hypothetical protein
MSVLFGGVMFVYSPPGVGKSTLGWTSTDDYSKMVYLDGDSSKERDWADAIGMNIFDDAETIFGYDKLPPGYYDLARLGAGKDELDYHNMVLSLIKLLPDDLDVLVFDNPSQFYLGGLAYVVSNKDKFRQVWRGTAEMIGGLEWQSVRKQHMVSFHTGLREKARLVMILTHEKEHHETKKEIPDADKSLTAAAQVIFRLVHNGRDSSNPAPAALVIKNAKIPDPKTHVPLRVFPLRIAPCDWSTMKDYFDNPVANRELLPHEMPDELEYHTIQGTLTPDQQVQLELRRQMATQKIEDTTQEEVLAVAKKHKKIKNPSLLVTKIVSELQDTIPGLTNDRVKEILDQEQE